MSYYDRYCNVDVLKGKTLESISGEAGDGEVVFKTTDGETYRMYHQQDCCESVYLNDVVGDMQDLVGSEILIAEEVEGDWSLKQIHSHEIDSEGDLILHL